MSETVSKHDTRLAQELRRIVLAVEASGRAILPSASDDLLRGVAETAARIFGAAAASIGLVDQKQQSLEFKVAVGVGSEEIVGTVMGLDQGIVGYAASTAQPLAISRVETDPRFAADVARRTGYVPKSIIAMPLVFDDHVLGVMELLDKGSGEPFGMDDMELLGMFARQAAIAIHLSQQFDLLGEVLVQRIDELVNPQNLPDLPRIERALDGPTDGERLAADLIDIADLFNSISELGPAERRACVEILGAFAEYVRSKPRFT